jgi:hypothetical protein
VRNLVPVDQLGKRCAREQLTRVGLLGPVLAQRLHLVADGGDHEEQRDQREEPDDLPESGT